MARSNPDRSWKRKELRKLQREREQNKKRKILDVEDGDADEPPPEGEGDADGPGGAGGKGEVDLKSLEFELSYDLQTMSDVSTRDLTLQQVNVIKFCLASSLYPNVSVADGGNVNRKAQEAVFSTFRKREVYMHPTSVYGSAPSLVGQGDMLTYSQILETSKAYLMNACRAPLLATMLLVCSVPCLSYPPHPIRVPSLCPGAAHAAGVSPSLPGTSVSPLLLISQRRGCGYGCVGGTNLQSEKVTFPILTEHRREPQRRAPPHRRLARGQLQGWSRRRARALRDAAHSHDDDIMPLGPSLQLRTFTSAPPRRGAPRGPSRPARHAGRGRHRRGRQGRRARFKGRGAHGDGTQVHRARPFAQPRSMDAASPVGEGAEGLGRRDPLSPGGCSSCEPRRRWRGLGPPPEAQGRSAGPDDRWMHIVGCISTTEHLDGIARARAWEYGSIDGSTQLST